MSLQGVFSHFNAHWNPSDESPNSHLNDFRRHYQRKNLSSKFLPWFYSDVLVVAMCCFPNEIWWQWSRVEGFQNRIQKNTMVATHKNYQVNAWIFSWRCNLTRVTAHCSQCSCRSWWWTTRVPHRQQPRKLKIRPSRPASGFRMELW